MNNVDRMTSEEMHDMFALTPEELVQQPPAGARKARLKGDFIMVPRAWAERLPGSTGATYALAHELLYLAWRRKDNELALSNRNAGVSRYSKWRGLRELEKRGLVTVELRPRRSPIVRLRHV